MRRTERPALVIALLLAAVAMTAHCADVETSLLRVIVTHQSYDSAQPWQKTPPYTRSAYGVVVGPGKVLTTESVVRNHTLIQLRRPQSGERLPAVVLTSDPYADLALLSIPDHATVDGLVPIDIAASIPTDARVSITQFDDTGELQESGGQVVKATVTPLSYGPGNQLAFGVLADRNVRGIGAPVMHEGKLAGLVMEYESSSRIATVLPGLLLHRFVSEMEANTYSGFATAGFTWTSLLDPSKRAYLGLKGKGTGILVLSTLANTGAAEVFESEDVILDWDGFAVDNLGYYEDPEFGRLLLPHLIKGRRRPGETVPVKILRDRKAMDVMVRLVRRMDQDAMIPANTTGERAEYLVEGGMVLRELTEDYLDQHVSDSRLTYLYMTKSSKPEQPGDRIVLLAKVLPDPINTGYERFRNQIVTHVNGDEIRNIQDLFRIKARDGHVTSLRLKRVGLDFVLDAEQLPMANARIAMKYGISELSYRRPAPASPPNE